MDEILLMDATALLEAYRNKTLSPREAVDAMLGAIDRFNPIVNAFCVVDHQGARAAAAESEARWMRSETRGVVDGVPFTIKDALLWRGFPVRGGSKGTPTSPASENAPAVDEMLGAGAIPLGKTTLPEAGWKALGDSPLYGITRNPWDTRMTTGGSSAGAGAAGALNLGALHIGMDSAGSIRIPSSFCGIFGLKPTHGRVSGYPPLPFALISDVGPMTRTVRDGALMLTAMAGPDRRDIWALQNEPPDYRAALNDGVRGLRVAWSPRLNFVQQLDAQVERMCASAARALEECGAHVEEASPPLNDPYDIIRMIWTTGSMSELGEIPQERWGECDPGFVVCAKAGADVKAIDFMANVNARTPLFQQMSEFHDTYDVLLTPTVATAPFEVGHNTPPDGRFGDDWMRWAPYSYPFDLTLQPAASVPCGMTESGLPVGLQIVAPLLRDDLVLRVARAFEQVRPWEMLGEPRVR
ncbi:MAG: amidase [Candidatus Eremiobacteraeota bacterium]|nr:amidase [Candidatus Eremiobacteraeota bacterium]